MDTGPGKVRAVVSPPPPSPLNPEMSNKTNVNAKNSSAGSSPPSTQLSIQVLDN